MLVVRMGFLFSKGAAKHRRVSDKRKWRWKRKSIVGVLRISL